MLAKRKKSKNFSFCSHGVFSKVQFLMYANNTLFEVNRLFVRKIITIISMRAVFEILYFLSRMMKLRNGKY